MSDSNDRLRGKGISRSDIHTALAFVHLDDRGDRSFSFCRNPGADQMLKAQDLPFDLIGNGRIFHFGSISMTDEPARLATIEALRFARKCNVVSVHSFIFRHSG
jgi:fructokinase